MVFGYLIATGIETGLELGFWTMRKLFNGIYTMTYGNQKDEKIQLQEEHQAQLKALRDEIGELKELIKLSSNPIKKIEG